MIHISGHSTLQYPEFIIRLEGDSNYTNIYSVKQTRPLLVSRTLLYFQLRLPSFLRISKSLLINPVYISRIVKKGRVIYLRLTDDTLVLVARRRNKETLAALTALSDLENNAT